jgi:hypothetical protein
MVDPTESKPPSRVSGLLLFAFGALLVGGAWLIPSQLKSLSAPVVREAGRGSQTVAQHGAELLAAGKPGVARLVAEAAEQLNQPESEILAEQIEAAMAASPEIAAWGRWDPFVTQAFAGLPARPSQGTIGQFLPRDGRKAAADYLGGSRHPGVQALLQLREAQGWERFMPVQSASGQPLEASILLAAMLLQADQFSPSAARELREAAAAAVGGGSIRRVETFLLDLLALGRRLDWSQLGELTRAVQSLEGLGQQRHLYHLESDAAPLIYSASLMGPSPEAVTGYLIRYGETGLESLRFAMAHGRGALNLLLRQQLLIDATFAGDPVEAGERPGPLARFSLQFPEFSLLAKYAITFIGAFLAIWGIDALAGLWRLTASPAAAYLRRGLGALFFACAIALLNEPYLARAHPLSGYDFQLIIPTLATTETTIQQPASARAVMETATITSILFFFLLQAVVYTVCLLKIREIDRQPIPDMLKYRLMENEENLFDSGLYVGIAGTCAALVMQVIGMIEANLLAAYSSNLFGILCVAFVKIRHVRPYKYKLLVRSQGQMPAGLVDPIGPAKL